MDVLNPDKPEFFAHYLIGAAKWLSVVDLKHRGAAALTGEQYQAIELQYIGARRFMVLEAIGKSFAVQ